MTEEEVLQLVATGAQERAPDRDALSRALLIFEKLSPDGLTDLERSLFAVVLRALETRLLADPGVRRLLPYWEALAGSRKERIAAHFKTEYGIRIPPETLSHIVKLTGGARSLKGVRSRVQTTTIRSVLRSAMRENGFGEVRCHHCGYHFSKDDFGSYGDSLPDAEICYSDGPTQARTLDLFKPLRRPGRAGREDESLTRLELDHLIPVLAFGSSDAGNLVASCRLCNAAKSIFRLPFEALPFALAVSLGHLPEEGATPWISVRMAVFCVILSQGQCSECGVSRESRELTFLIGREGRDLSLTAPWGGQVLCYPCREGFLD